MVETGGEYVLQWSGHAASITERFSSLLARQALVDVTLLCQNQELRVHKLVLASCSLYFEEMLEQDLGQEPTIILNDLHFNILKAMIEFMYCGETTIAHCHLHSLLDAARVFKVKDLELLVTSMIDVTVELASESSQDLDIKEQPPVLPLPPITISSESPTPEIDAESFSSTDIFEEEDSSSSSTTGSPPELESVLDTLEEELPTCDCSSEVKPCQDSHPGEDYVDYSPGGIGECSRVYTHKKRASLNPRKSQLLPLNMSQLDDSTSKTDCIDLSYDKNCDISPVTFTPLELESEYMFSLNSEGIQSSLNPGNCSIPERKNIYDEPGYNIRKIKELFSNENRCNNIGATPVLRRSVRLNQLDNDDTNNNSQSINCHRNRDCKKQQLKELKKFSNKIKSIKLNGKSKDSEPRISDENRKHVFNSNNSRSLRSTRKIVTKNSSKLSLAREEQKSKNSKLKGGKMDKIDSLNCDYYVPLQLNTIASVDRYLWGDMSDLLENARSERRPVLPDYSKSKEIPFAVGLLPLRAALERMQAIPDYQPRKTRSSVAPYKIDSCGLKRKANGDIEAIVISKKQCSPGAVINDSDTVCHIQIHTSSQCEQREKIVEAKPFIQVEPTSDKR